MSKVKWTPEEMYNWYNYNIDRVNRTLFFGPWNDADTGLGSAESRDPWEVNDWSAQNIIKGLHILEQEGDEAITLNWLSYGGDWNAGMAIYDYMKTCKSHITMKCFGRVRSMGTIILQAADERLISPNCEFMIHYGSLAIAETHSKNAAVELELENRNNAKMEEIYLERIREKKARFSKTKLQELITYDKFMTPNEAIDLGLADRIL